MSDLKAAIKKLKTTAASDARYEQYYTGQHKVNYASSDFKQKFGQRIQHLNDNLCAAVVDTPASRLEVINFGDESKEIDQAAWNIWQRNLMPLRSADVHRTAVMCGSAYVIVWPEGNGSGRARFYPQKPGQCVAFEDCETGNLKWGAKMWRDEVDKKIYITLYYPDRLERYISKDELTALPDDDRSFVPRQDDAVVVNPYGQLPIIRFYRGARILDPVMPLQDALNKTLADLFVAMEYNSIRQRWASGLSLPIDPETSKPVVPWKENDRFLFTQDAGGKFGEFSDMDLSQHVTVADSLRAEIARVSGIPAHYFMLGGVSFPSGEAMKVAETRFTSMIKEMQLSFGDSWGRAMALAMRIDSEGGDISPVVAWSDAAPSSDSDFLNNAVLKQQLGWSNKRIQADYGLTEAEIEQMSAERAEEKELIEEAAGRMFDAGEV